MPARTVENLNPEDLEFLVLLDQLGRRRLSQRARQLRSSGPVSECLLPPDGSKRRLILERAPKDHARTSAALRLRESLKRIDASVLWFEDLPVQLRAIPDPPWALYLCGSSTLLNQPAIALVGARQCTARGREWATVTAGDLAAVGFVIVSGLALGIDAAAHRGATHQTIAVLGSGLSQPTPLRHQPLAEQIVEAGGTLLSEYAPERPALAFQFPERNRLVSGLAQGVVVVEAGPRSGSLITARLALEQGRELMAVPGPAGFPNAAGCHRLLRQGATLVEQASDIAEVFADQAEIRSLLSLKKDSSETAPLETAPLETAALKTADPASLAHFAETDVDLAQQLYLACDGVPQSLDSLIGAVQADPSRIAYLLTLLELRGLVRRAANGYYR